MAVNDSFLKGLQRELTTRKAQWQGRRTFFFSLSPKQRRLRLGYAPQPGELSARQLEEVSRSHAQRHLYLLHNRPGLLARYTRAAPAGWDWRNAGGRGFVDGVRDQGDCGACVAFAVVGAVEAGVRIHHDVAVGDIPGFSLDLSEAQLFACGAGKRCEDGWNFPDALRYCQTTGITVESDFAYQPRDQSCSLPADWTYRSTKVGKYHRITSINQMKSWLSSHGPLVTRFNVYEDFMAYDSGVYRHVSGSFEGGHAVLCIGYSDDRQAWLCKNSWGADFGESGYFWIGYGECGIDAQMYAIDAFSRTLPIKPVIVWWEEKDFRGRRHTRWLPGFPQKVCNPLVHNDAMKSVKFFGQPGWRLELYDSSGCSRKDDWSEVIFPDDPNVKAVDVPKIGRRGPGEVVPRGCYRFHYVNGLPGKVSSIRYYKTEKTAKLVWWEEKDFRGRSHTRTLYPSEHGKNLNLVHNDKMKSLKLYAHPGWRLEIYDARNCSKSDDWAEVIFPGNSGVKHVDVPKIGKRGVREVRPAGCYRFHYKNGLPGKVSSMKHFG